MGDEDLICERCHWYNGAFFCIKFWKDVAYDGTCDEIEIGSCGYDDVLNDENEEDSGDE